MIRGFLMSPLREIFVYRDEKKKTRRASNYDAAKRSL